MELEDPIQQAESNYKKALDLGYDKFAYLGLAKMYMKTNDITMAIEMFTILFDREANDTRVSEEFKQLLKKYPKAKNLLRNASKTALSDHQ